GGVMEALTAATSLAVLGPTFQISTRVMDGADEGTVVLVGRGDPTLSRLPAGEESVYPGAPKLADLAAQVVEAYGQKHPEEPLRRLELDATYWGLDDRWDDTWDRGAQTGGAQGEVVALQVDGDRDDPTAQNSPRSSGPIGRAGDAFAQALKDADTEGVVIDEGIEIETGEAPGGTDLLGEVRSQPLRQLIPQMLQTGDSSLAESLARIASKESDRDGSAASLTETYTAALGPSGFDTEGLAVRDGSGLSAENAIPPSALAEFMARIHGGDQNLQIIRDSLPVSGESGGLADRFTGDNAEVQGDVTGLAGRIASAATLAGTVEAADGTSLAFAFAGVQDGIDDGAVAALDTLATAVYRCGSNLSSN
ncbi:MAG: D-alanyl-D-alanine carboxypeptidase, partial [Microbacteriaceae bacterium]